MKGNSWAGLTKGGTEVLRKAEHCWKGFLSVCVCVCCAWGRDRETAPLCTCLNVCQFEYQTSLPLMKATKKKDFEYSMNGKNNEVCYSQIHICRSNWYLSTMHTENTAQLSFVHLLPTNANMRNIEIKGHFMNPVCFLMIISCNKNRWCWIIIFFFALQNFSFRKTSYEVYCHAEGLVFLSKALGAYFRASPIKIMYIFQNIWKKWLTRHKNTQLPCSS